MNVKPTMNRFGEKLRFLRLQHSLTTRKLAEYLEVHNTYINKIELGQRNPTSDLVLKTAHFFNVSTDRLMRDDLELEG